MRDFLEELKCSDDMLGYIVEHKKEAVKLAAVAVGIMTALLLLLYRGGDDVELTDTATPLRSGDGYEQAAAGGEGGEAATSGGSVSGASGGSAADGGATSGKVDVYVDIGGAVKTPKLAKLPPGSRVEDAITEAGGLAADADLTQINRAEIVTDGQKIYIPTREEVASGTWQAAGSSLTGGAVGTGGTGGSGGGSVTAGASGSKVNINTADITQLQTITGVGPVTAQKIIDYRTQNGNFGSIEDLKNVSGIGEKTFENMKEQVTV